MRAPPNWIQLYRRFLPVSDEISPELAAELFRLAKRSQGWEDLLRGSCTVVLGEAGTGKTAELRGRVSQLRGDGKNAFFVPVEQLARGGVAKSLDVDDARSLRNWLTDESAEAWFMLDSVDESQLKGLSLCTGLNALGQELESTLHRIRIVLSSRASDWRSADEEHVDAIASHLAPPVAGAPAVQMVQLAPLDEGQVAALAAHHGVGDAAAFLAAVRDANAWKFLERPLDLGWLVRYWISHGHLGGLRDLLDFNITERLKEKTSRPGVLSPAKARAGARALALVATLTQTAAFRLPEEVIDPKAEDAVDPRVVLSAWTNDEVRDLLARGLFDEATYGRVRFHHRSVQEYLAAEQLATLQKAGLTKLTLEGLLFRQSSGRTVIPRYLAPTVAWLAGTDRDVLRQAIAFAPEHLIDEGDPSALSPDVRRTTLTAYARRFRDRDQVFHYFDTFGLQRFACIELADTIRQLLAEPNEPEHLKRTLLRTIEKGKLAPLADAALSSALEPGASLYVRTAAIRATRAVGDEALQAQLAPLASAACATDPEVLAALLDILFPAKLSPAVVVGLLATVARERMTITNLDVLAPGLPSRCNPEARAHFLTELTSVMRAATRTTGKPVQINPAHLWLGECLAELVTATVEAGSPYPPALPEAIDLLCEVQDCPDATVHRRVEAILSAHPQVRREMFWRHVAACAANRPFPRRYWDLHVIGTVAPTDADITWLSEDVVGRADVRERLLAFDCLVRAFPRANSTQVEVVAALGAIAGASDAARGERALTKRFERLLNPPFFPDHHSIWNMQRRHRASEMRTERVQRENHSHLLAILAEIRAGIHEGALLHLYATCLSESGSHHGTVTRKSIAEKYGADTADAAIEGFRQFWRIHDPVRREDEEPSRTPRLCMVGLVGIDHDIQEDVDLLALPEPLLRKALVYACWELNGFPDWFVQCATARPDLVREVFAPSLRLDLESPPPAQPPSLGRLLYKVEYAAPEIRSAVAPIVLDMVRGGEPPDVEMLDRALQLLRSTGAMPDGEATALAQTRASATNDPARQALWVSLWIESDAASAIDYLSRALDDAANPALLAEETFSRIWTRHQEDGVPLMARLGRSAILKLIRLTYAHVRTEDDIKHHGQGMDPVGKRDHSQDLRNALIGWLAQIPGAEVVEALDELAGDPQFTAQRDWLRHLADTRAVENVTVERMSVVEAVRLVDSLVIEPSTTAELFAVALNRLEDIQQELSDGDFGGFRGAFNPPTPEGVLEEHVQNYLAQQLELRRTGQYTVAREPEVNRKKKPDIRIFNPRCDGPVTIEAKIAQRWTLPQLEDSLRHQLVGAYMAANSSKYGILAVCSSGTKRGWQIAAGAPDADFKEVVARLRTLAGDIVATNHQVLGLHVVVIDFH
jgi:hypothetical protein